MFNGRLQLFEAIDLDAQDISLLRELEADKHSSLSAKLLDVLKSSVSISDDNKAVSLRSIVSNLFFALSSSLSQSTDVIDLPALATQFIGSWPTPLTLSVSASSSHSSSALSVHALIDPLSLAGRRGIAQIGRAHV